MAKKQQAKGTTPKGAVELKEDALDQASGGILKSKVGGGKNAALTGWGG